MERFSLIRRDSRRGGAAVEFALTFPILALILAGTIDYGWYFTQQVRVLSIARDAARQGAADGADPEGVAEAVAVVLFDHSGIDCGRLLCTVDSRVDGSLPVDTLRVTVRADFDPLAGMLYFGTEDGLPLVPAGLSATAVFPLLD